MDPSDVGKRVRVKNPNTPLFLKLTRTGTIIDYIGPVQSAFKGKQQYIFLVKHYVGGSYKYWEYDLELLELIQSDVDFFIDEEE